MNELTSDEPYLPEFGNDEDAHEVLASTRPGSPVQPSARNSSSQRGNRSGVSLLRPPDAELQGRLDAAEAKLSSGQQLEANELRTIGQLSLLRLLGARRPAAVATGLQLLEKMLAHETAPAQEATSDAPRRGRIGIPHPSAPR